MYDGHEINVGQVGHRRWFLSPHMDRIGWGTVTEEASGSKGDFQAAFVFSANNPSLVSDVCWPAQTRVRRRCC